ncbi:MAG: hypothetical protein ACFB9M_09950 [Myxococcota bacterium]
MRASLVEPEQWSSEAITEIETRLLQGIFGCRSTEAVEAAIKYAKFLSSVGITPDNYPVFLNMLEIENHFVVDALIGDRDPFLLLSSVQPNEFIVRRVFAMLTRWHKDGIYGKNISVILGVLQSLYSSPRDGYRVYPLRIADVNALGKHLDKNKGQDEPLNRAILEVLEKISELEDVHNREMEEVAIHASAVRNAFFDDRKRMEEVIPPVLLVSAGNRNEMKPRRSVPMSDAYKVDSSLPAREPTEAASAPKPAAPSKDGPSKDSATDPNKPASS